MKTNAWEGLPEGGFSRQVDTMDALVVPVPGRIKSWFKLGRAGSMDEILFAADLMLVTGSTGLSRQAAMGWGHVTTGEVLLRLMRCQWPRL